MARLVGYFKQLFSVFNQHYTHFNILFHSHVYQKTTNNITQTPLPNGPNFAQKSFMSFLLFFFIRNHLCTLSLKLVNST